jgi:hypothetical protein
MLSKWAEANNQKYIRCGYDGTHITVTNRVPRWNTRAKARTGYEIEPSWVAPAIIAAGFAVSKAMYCPDIEAGFDLREINGSVNRVVADKKGQS